MFHPLFAYVTRTTLLVTLLLVFNCCPVFAGPRTASASGNWSDLAIWGGTTAPITSDDISFINGQSIVLDIDVTIKDLNLAANCTLTIAPGKRLTLNGNLTVNGNLNMNGGSITLGSPGLLFTLGPNSTFIWDPGINNSTEATLFTRGVENFSPTSTLIIKRWHNYSTALGSLVTGDFGNLTLNSPSGASAIVEWDQNNQFQTHQILGTLTIDQGWITLDKSGSISNTTLSNVVLTSVNSFLYGHNGNHPGSFSLNTGNITNNGGTIYGLNDGTGNVTLKTVGNFTNIGNFKVIMNSGVTGAGNGNATFNVTGTFAQSTGDTRLIYNVASSTSGVFDCTIGTLNLTGGIFMGQTACHTSGGTCTMNISNNMNVNFTGNSDKFRGTSLSSIGANINNTKFNLTVGGNLVFSGPVSAEFTSSASLGTENIVIGGALQVSGGVFSINYGSSASGHNINVQIGGNLAISGGSTFLTRNAGVGTIAVGGMMSVATGMLTLKSSTGVVQMIVSGQYNQSSGTVYLHGNSAQISQDKITLSIQGNFTQSSGMLSFDDNSDNSNATHELLIYGSAYSLSGTGQITHSGIGTSQSFGLIRFLRNGTTVYSRTSGHQLQQVRQDIEANNILAVNSGNVQVCSHATAATNYLRIRPLGRLQLNAGQIQSDGVNANSGMQVDDSGVLEITSASGLYNGSNTGSISSAGNMNYSLDPNSIVEYTGTANQTLTGTSYAITTGANHKYGVLKIRSQSGSSAIITDSQIFVRTALILESGSIDLNGQSLVIENGNSTAVQRTGGFVKSESDDASIVWNNMNSGVHEFPFGISPTVYIPVLFTPLTGLGNNVSISIKSTSNSDNTPIPSNLLATVLSLINFGYAENEVIDRWWKVSATGMTANVTLKFNSAENTLSLANRLSPLGLRSWNTLSWTEPRGFGFGVLTGIGSVTISNVSNFSNWILATNNAVLPIELSLFQAKPFKNEVRLDWATSTEINNDYFNIERSEDGISFIQLTKIAGAGTSSEYKKYSYIDIDPVQGRSYYRLKQTDYDGKFTYSDIKSVVFGKQGNTNLQIENISPNPFEHSFRADYNLPEAGEVKASLINSAGKIVRSKIEKADKGKNQFEFQEVADLPSGTYILQLLWNGQMETKKLIKK